MLKWLDTDVVSSLSLHTGLLSQLVGSFVFWIVFVLNYNVTRILLVGMLQGISIIRHIS